MWVLLPNPSAFPEFTLLFSCLGVFVFLPIWTAGRYCVADKMAHEVDEAEVPEHCGALFVTTLCDDEVWNLCFGAKKLA